LLSDINNMLNFGYKCVISYFGGAVVRIIPLKRPVK
jgi:hypothetical protein